MTTLADDVTDLDLFADATLADPYPVYSRLRDAGPAVWLERVECWVIPRHAGVRDALENWERFTTARGVGLNDTMNRQTQGTVLASDPPLHTALRSVLSERLSARAVRGLEPGVRAKADDLVDRLVRRGTFDGVADLARVYPLEVMCDLIGLPQDVRPQVLGWADGTFDALGPSNGRTVQALPRVEQMFAWLFRLEPRRLAPGSMGRAIYEAADAGTIEPACAPLLLAAYVAAGMDTTISAIGWALELFARHPDQWAALRADRLLVPSAFNEVLRYESPVQLFTRVATEDTELDGVTIPRGARVIVLYGSANRDERRYGADAASFDITRDAGDQLAFGRGLHGCAGQTLARIEAHAVLNALADRVERLDGAGTPVHHLNNLTRSLSSLPLTVHCA